MTALKWTQFIIKTISIFFLKAVNIAVKKIMFYYRMDVWTHWLSSVSLDDTICEIKKIYRHMVLNTGLYNKYFTTCYLSDCFYEVYRASLFSVCVLIKNLLVTRQNIPSLLWKVRACSWEERWCHCFYGPSTAVRVGKVVWAMRHNTAFTKVEELSPHGLIMAFMLLALNSLASGWSGQVGIRWELCPGKERPAERNKWN